MQSHMILLLLLLISFKRKKKGYWNKGDSYAFGPHVDLLGNFDIRGIQEEIAIC